jgi:2,3-bisphosphoglycerate-independent phosphoglycerate mutase
MKIFLLVLDGLADRPCNELNGKTPLSAAKKTAIDRFATKGKVGLLDIGYKGAVNSDFGYLNLLGCWSVNDYPGRGYLEALGVGLKPGPTDIALRANWATLDRDGNIKDRRAGREETGLDRLAALLDGIHINGVKFTVRQGVGHRLVIVMSGRGLSEAIIPNDPLKEGVAVREIRAKNELGKHTADVLNAFLKISREKLIKEPINKRRKWPANCILIRNVGRKRETASFQARYGLKGACIAGIPIAKGVCKWLGLDILDVAGATGKPETNLNGKFLKAITALPKYDFIFLHINGTDILSHDGLAREKVKYIEKIDKLIAKYSNELSKVRFILTCDHGTASSKSYKQYRHLSDPVPVLISGPGIKPNHIDHFDEEWAKKSFHMKANQLISYICKL